MKGFILLECNNISSFHKSKNDLISSIEVIDARSGEFQVYDFDGWKYQFDIKKKTFKIFWGFTTTTLDVIVDINKTEINERKKIRQILINEIEEEKNIKILNLSLEESIKLVIDFWGYSP